MDDKQGWSSLAGELLSRVCAHLPPQDVAACRAVCSWWRDLVQLRVPVSLGHLPDLISEKTCLLHITFKTNQPLALCRARLRKERSAGKQMRRLEQAEKEEAKEVEQVKAFIGWLSSLRGTPHAVSSIDLCGVPKGSEITSLLVDLACEDVCNPSSLHLRWCTPTPLLETLQSVTELRLEAEVDEIRRCLTASAAFSANLKSLVMTVGHRRPVQYKNSWGKQEGDNPLHPLPSLSCMHVEESKATFHTRGIAMLEQDVLMCAPNVEEIRVQHIEAQGLEEVLASGGARALRVLITDTSELTEAHLNAILRLPSVERIAVFGQKWASEGPDSESAAEASTEAMMAEGCGSTVQNTTVLEVCADEMQSKEFLQAIVRSCKGLRRLWAPEVELSPQEVEDVRAALPDACNAVLWGDEVEMRAERKRRKAEEEAQQQERELKRAEMIAARSDETNKKCTVQ
eukprot:TRINITY_DN6414_c0_g1_i2.p1 TRINITY_DN6414_c0_g1~~TRINITY_DN6414_c0_g1_i2.p1  ORF type:complete len:468 (-),score=108.88 TRINITY_DN6414_c0_g1_i2:45-1415(-)